MDNNSTANQQKKKRDFSIGNVVGTSLPHIVIVLSAMFITFWILDKINPIMDFINNSLSNKLLIIFCVVAMINSICSVVWYRKVKQLKEK